MKAILMIALLVAGILAVVGLASLAVVTVGIRREERRAGLFPQPHASAEIFARSVLGVYIRRPGYSAELDPRRVQPVEALPSTPSQDQTDASAADPRGEEHPRT
jgi:hypothetical protein